MTIFQRKKIPRTSEISTVGQAVHQEIAKHNWEISELYFLREK
jgi:hypothetical protein